MPEIIKMPIINKHGLISFIIILNINYSHNLEGKCYATKWLLFFFDQINCIKHVDVLFI